jgi:polysaccharide biosynthesis transport protein
MDTQEISPSQGADPGHYLRILRERKWVIAATVLVTLTAALALSFLATPKYRASSQLLYQRPKLDQALFGSPIFDSYNKEREVQTGARLVKLEAVAVGVRKALDSPRDEEELLRMVTVQPEGQTDVVQIAAVSDDPEEAAAVANSFAEEFLRFRRNTDQRAIAEARELVSSQLDSLQPSEASSSHANMLREKHEELRILETMQNGGFEIVQMAGAPVDPFSPRPLRNAGLSLVVGLLLGAGLAFVFEYADKRLKDEQSMEREFGLPALALVPAVGGRWLRRPGKDGQGPSSRVPIGFSAPGSPLLEPFRTLRSNLHFLNVDRRLRTILLTSAVPQDGKTVTAINLALSLAVSGERVILIEADLRRPMLHDYLGLTNTVGVSTVLAGASDFGDSLQLVRVDQFVAHGDRAGASATRLSRNLYCLTSGPIPPNPAELVGSDRMRELVAKASEAADFVIIDSPPLLAVAEGLTLAQYVDGVVIAALARHTTRDDARRVTRMLERVGANSVGLVIGDAKTPGNAETEYGYRRQEHWAQN